jgi:hypothetical protein
MFVEGPVQECVHAAKQIGIDKIGASYDGKVTESVVYRNPSTLPVPNKLPCIVVTTQIDLLQEADLISVSNFHKAKDKLKKKLRKGLALEFLLHPAREMDGAGIARWLQDLREAYLFCHSSGCQFVLSSGAKSPSEMISGNCFDAILAEINVDPRKHWRDLDLWLTEALTSKVTAK